MLGHARWQVGPNYWNDQLLTDRLVFECEIPESDQYALRIDPVAGNTRFVELQPNNGKDIEIVVFNRDDGNGSADPMTLEDFRVLYGLVAVPGSLEPPRYSRILPTSRPNGSPSVWPIPAFDTIGECPPKEVKKMGTTDPEFPICGGGQADPDPPEGMP